MKSFSVRQSHTALLFAVFASLVFSWAVIVLSRDVSNELERVIAGERDISSGLTLLIDVEEAASALNRPGNDLFRSLSVSKEKQALREASDYYQTTVKDLMAWKAKSPILWTGEQIAFQTILDLGSRIYVQTLQEFDLFAKKNIQGASAQMADMDQTYSELRQTIIQMRRVLRDRRESELFQLHRLSRERLSSFRVVAGVQFIFSIAFLALGLWAFSASRENRRLLGFYKYALDSVAMVAVTDRAGTIQHINDKFAAVTGFSSTDLIGQNHRILNSGFHSRDFFQGLWETIRSGAVWNGTVRNQRKDGTHYWVDSTIVPRTRHGEVQDYFAVQYDVTAKKELSDALEASRQRYALALDVINVGIWEADSRYEVTCSAKLVDMLGLLPHGQRFGIRTLLKLMHPLQRRSFLVDLRNCVGGKVLDSELHLASPTGRRWFRVTAKAVRGESSFRIIGSLQDVDETKRLHSGLELAKIQAESAAETKAKFLANMSHEIRTPLAGLIGTLALLRDENLSAEGRNLVEIAGDCGESLKHLLGDVLDFSRIEAGKIVLETYQFELRRVLADLADLHRSSATKKGLDLVVEKVSQDFHLKGDAHRFRQILGNLLSNAIKFTETGEVRVKAEVIARDAKTIRFRFSVQDTGLGIPEDVRAKLFQSFSQVDASTTRTFGGTGLGLAICKGLCEAMGGIIGVVSSEGAGSVFHFELPFEVDSQRSRAVVPRESLDVALPFREKRVLVVDDNGTNRFVARRFLEKLGAEVATSASATEAIGAFESGDFDLAFIDSQMPTMDGIQLVSYARSRNLLKKCHLVAFTASNTVAERERWRAEGVSSFLTKPFALADLHGIARRLGWSDSGVALGEAEVSEREALLASFDGDMELLRQAWRALDANVSAKLPLLRRACDEMNIVDIRFIAHFLKGTCSYFGDRSAVDCLSQLEEVGERSQQEILSVYNDAEKALEDLVLRVDRISRRKDAA